MPITGSQKAKMYARLGVMRVGASRLDYYKPDLYLTINGVDRKATRQVRTADLTIRDYLDGEPNIATLRVEGFTPTSGHEIRIGLGSLDRYHRIFAGNVQTINQLYDTDNKANVVWELTCTSYEWLLNRRKVNYRYVNQSASDIASHLITNNTASFTTTKVEPGLATVDEITFTNEDVTDCLDRLARRIGAYWYIDNDRDLHFFITLNLEGRAQTIDDSGVHGMQALPALSITTDMAPVRTRIYVEGGGGVAVAPLANGQTTIPVDDISWYNPSGGTVVVGVNRVTYAGVSGIDGLGSVVGTKVTAPTTAPTLTEVSTGFAGGTVVKYRVTFFNSEGETDPGPIATITISGGSHGLTVSNIEIPSGTFSSVVTGRRVYRSTDGGSTWVRYFTINNNTSTSVGDTNTAPESTATYPPANTAGFVEESFPAGSTSLVQTSTSWPASGGWILVAGQYIRFTGTSGNSLTGIPSSGIGAITADITSGSQIITVPHLTGIPSLADGSIGYFRPAGDPINLLVMTEDAAAQAAMATAIGGDGIHEEYFQDNRLSETEALAQAAAHLALLKDPLVTVRYDTRDQGTRSGRKVTFNLSAPTSLSGTFKVQSVLISQFSEDGSFFPRRSVEASNRRQSFEAMLRMLRGAAA
jgi:hypothetical protein